FTREKDRNLATKYRDEFLKGEIDIALPDLILYELANVLRYNPNFDERDVSDAIRSIIGLGIQILVPTTHLLNIAIDLGFKYGITVYDAVYMALAEELKYDFVTADKKLFDTIKSLDFVKFLE
ncbi:MAG: type II toxin-antitoxin system VapC family toxin, partial [Candidatus Methanofastidiosia archaeon]